mmetsp:Transcript_865/g.942  ORF Transcript_865/g.942 Transcript_865/m.942 type:complete len:126 (+) Transcript_865:420-797(+)
MGSIETEYDWMDELIKEELQELELKEEPKLSQQEGDHSKNSNVQKKTGKSKENRKIKSKKKCEMKLKEKHSRRGNGLSNVRFKRGASISAKQWARMDDVARERAIKSGAMPPYKVEKRKKRLAKA